MVNQFQIEEYGIERLAIASDKRNIKSVGDAAVRFPVLIGLNHGMRSTVLEYQRRSVLQHFDDLPLLASMPHAQPDEIAQLFDSNIEVRGQHGCSIRSGHRRAQRAGRN